MIRPTGANARSKCVFSQKTFKKQMRLLAEDIQDEISKRMMLNIADDYELLARPAEGQSGVRKVTEDRS